MNVSEKCALVSLLLNHRHLYDVGIFHQLVATPVSQWPQVQPDKVGFQHKMLSLLQRRWEWCLKQGGRILYPGHPEYPSSFVHLVQPPMFLHVRGAELCSHLSVVGARKVSDDSREWLDRVFRQFVRTRPDMRVSSGGAPGVDSLTHEICIFEQVGTQVFLPCGFCFTSYWSRWRSRLHETKDTLISEYLPDTPIRRLHFHQRNRLIAAMSPALLVVQAGPRSGTLLTANLATDFGREIGVLPGHPSSSESLGSLKLLQNGAQMIIDGSDISNLMRSI